MKQTKIYLFAATALLLAACNSNDEQALSGNGRYPADNRVRIAAEVNAHLNALSTTAYQGTDLAMTIDYGTTSHYTAHNIKWTRSGSTWTPAQKMLWQDATTPCNIYAYAPTNGCTVLNDSIIALVIPTDQSAGIEAADLVGFTQTGFVPGNSLTTKQAVNIDFTHINAKVTFQISFADEFGGQNPTVDSVVMKRLVSGIMYNCIRKTVELDDNIDLSNASIKTHKVSATAFEAIIPPQGIAFEIANIYTSNGAMYSVSMPNQINFASGSAYTISATVGKDLVTVGTVKVADWTTQDTTGFETEGQMVTIDTDIASMLAQNNKVPVVNGNQLNLGDPATIAALNAITSFDTQFANSINGLQYMPNLNSLTVGVNYNGDLDLSRLTKLTEFSTNSSEINLKNISKLDLHKLVISSLNNTREIPDISSFTNMEELVINGTTLPVNIQNALLKMTKLTTLQFDGYQGSITSLDLSANTLLQKLNLMHSTLTSITLPHTSTLTSMDFTGGKFPSLDFTVLSVTQFISLEFSYITVPLTIYMTAEQNKDWEARLKQWAPTTVTVVVK